MTENTTPADVAGGAGTLAVSGTPGPAREAGELPDTINLAHTAPDAADEYVAQDAQDVDPNVAHEAQDAAPDAAQDGEAPAAPAQ